VIASVCPFDCPLVGLHQKFSSDFQYYILYAQLIRETPLNFGVYPTQNG